MGAGTAIRDAAALLDQLCEVTDGTAGLTVAVSRYEAGMRLRGSETLTVAMKTVDRIRATDTALGAAATTAATPVLAAAHRLLRRGRCHAVRLARGCPLSHTGRSC